jgi:spore germination protein YaaH
VAIFIFSKSNKISVKNSSLQKNNSEEKINAPVVNTQPFFVAGWLPYWRKEEGAASLNGKINLFSEINPFDFGVTPDGNIIDTPRIANSPWPKLRAEAKKANVNIIPTILWGDAEAMHRTFTNPKLLAHHVDAIDAMLQQDDFSGVDIDYEGKDVADRDNFSLFLKTLHEKINPSEKTISCTVEARTQDSPPVGWGGTRAMSYANDFSALNNFCDSVRLMAYDESFQVHGEHQIFEDKNETPLAPNADNQWVEEVMRYALHFFPPEKIVVGIPTYGWEFKLTKLAEGYRYTRVKSINYPDAINEAKKAGVEPKRNAGGEMNFIYQTSDGQHIVTFSDAESIRKKIEIAKKLNLKGISLFKIDGLSDPQLFSVLEKAADFQK